MEKFDLSFLYLKLLLFSYMSSILEGIEKNKKEAQRKNIMIRESLNTEFNHKQWA